MEERKIEFKLGKTCYHTMGLLHLILCEVPLPDFHHIDGNLLLVPWNYSTHVEGLIFTEPLIFMGSYHLMEVFCWGSLTSSWLDDYAFYLVVFPHVIFLLITHWFYFWSMWSILSHYGGLIYICCACVCLCYILYLDDGSIPPRG
jgi:hypothetical protein